MTTPKKHTRYVAPFILSALFCCPSIFANDNNNLPAPTVIYIQHPIEQSSSHTNLLNTTVEAGVGLTYNTPGIESTLLTISNYEFDSIAKATQWTNISTYVTVKKNYAILWPTLARVIPEFSLGPILYYQYNISSGQVYQFQNITQNNYSYRYTNALYNLYMETNLFLPSLDKHRVTPFVLLGIGDSISSVSYNENAVPGVPVSSEIHVNQQVNQNFGFEAGVGLAVYLSKTCDITARYVHQIAHEHATGLSDNGGLSLRSTISINLVSDSAFVALNYKF